MQHHFIQLGTSVVLLDGWKTLWNIRPEVFTFFGSLVLQWQGCRDARLCWQVCRSPQMVRGTQKHLEAWLPFRGACTDFMRELAETLWNEANNLFSSLGWTSSGHWYILGSPWQAALLLQTCKAIVASSLSVSWQDALAANCVLGFPNSSTARKVREKFICF